MSLTYFGTKHLLIFFSRLPAALRFWACAILEKKKPWSQTEVLSGWTSSNRSFYSYRHLICDKGPIKSHYKLLFNVASQKKKKPRRRIWMMLISTKSYDLSPLIFNHWALRGYFVPPHRCEELMPPVMWQSLGFGPLGCRRDFWAVNNQSSSLHLR